MKTNITMGTNRQEHEISGGSEVKYSQFKAILNSIFCLSFYESIATAKASKFWILQHPMSGNISGDGRKWSQGHSERSNTQINNWELQIKQHGYKGNHHIPTFSSFLVDVVLVRYVQLKLKNGLNWYENRNDIRWFLLTS